MKTKEESFIDPVLASLYTITIILTIVSCYFGIQAVKEHTAKIDFFTDSVNRIEAKIEKLEEAMILQNDNLEMQDRELMRENEDVAGKGD